MRDRHRCVIDNCTLVASSGRANEPAYFLPLTIMNLLTKRGKEGRGGREGVRERKWAISLSIDVA